MATAEVPILDTLTAEAKQRLLGALLLDLSASETSSLSVEAGGRTFRVYCPPLNAREDARQFLSQCSPAFLEEGRRVAQDPDPKNWMTLEDMFRVVTEDATRTAAAQKGG